MHAAFEIGMNYSSLLLIVCLLESRSNSEPVSVTPLDQMNEFHSVSTKIPSSFYYYYC